MPVPRRIIKKRIGEILVERGAIARQQLAQALEYVKTNGGQTGQVLVQLGFVTEEDVALALTAQYAFPYLPLENYEIDEELTKIIPEALARKHCLTPIDQVGNALSLAMADPSNVEAVHEVEMLTKCVVQACISTPSAILKAIDRLYKPQGAGDPPPDATPASSPKDT